ncbi:hypothetical protein KQ944_12485 [Bacillus subtilis]|nr:DUF6615 family protein [Pseudochrobactrum asaccharolyticum]MCF7645983.1 hypothetical protein [Pseudochrobactrum asaccharolyticum]MCF7672450.1 hypothetical protein [Bacillus subtilis]
MAGLSTFKSFGIHVDFPNEPVTGGDMEWIFVAPNQLNGGAFFSLLIQAKRARLAKRKKGDYWLYDHLDHGSPAGSQAQTLINYTKSTKGATAPLYMFYNPLSATEPAKGTLPAIEGINLVFADFIAPVIKNGCTVNEKKVDRWRKHFMPLSNILCHSCNAKPSHKYIHANLFTKNYWNHPSFIVRRLNKIYKSQLNDTENRNINSKFKIKRGIPSNIIRSINGDTTKEDIMNLERPRVIFSSSATAFFD